MHTLIIIDTSNRIINLSYFNNLKGDTLISTNKTIFSIYKSNAESALVEILKRKLAENLEQMDLLEKSIIKLQAQIDSL